VARRNGRVAKTRARSRSLVRSRAPGSRVPGRSRGCGAADPVRVGRRSVRGGGDRGITAFHEPGEPASRAVARSISTLPAHSLAAPPDVWPRGRSDEPGVAAARDASSGGRTTSPSSKIEDRAVRHGGEGIRGRGCHGSGRVRGRGGTPRRSAASPRRSPRAGSADNWPMIPPGPGQRAGQLVGSRRWRSSVNGSPSCCGASVTAPAAPERHAPGTSRTVIDRHRLGTALRSSFDEYPRSPSRRSGPRTMTATPGPCRIDPA
jgi:hypothetical protein